MAAAYAASQPPTQGALRVLYVEHLNANPLDPQIAASCRQAVQQLEALGHRLQQEVAKANRILAASREAAARGSGVVALDGKMIDRPVVLRAERTLELAYASRAVFEEDEQ